MLSFGRAVDAAPANYLHRLSLGENLQRRCRVAEAFEQYQRAALLAPHSSRVQAHARLTRPATDAVHAEPPGAAGSGGSCGGGVAAAAAAAAAAAPGGAAAGAVVGARAGADAMVGAEAAVGTEPPSLTDLVVSRAEDGWQERTHSTPTPNPKLLP